MDALILRLFPLLLGEGSSLDIYLIHSGSLGRSILEMRKMIASRLLYPLLQWQSSCLVTSELSLDKSVLCPNLTWTLSSIQLPPSCGILFSNTMTHPSPVSFHLTGCFFFISLAVSFLFPLLTSMLLDL